MLQHALAPSIADAHARSRLPAQPGGDPTSHPYLKITGAVPLRFDAPPPPPDLSSKPPAGAPPIATGPALPDVILPAATPPAEPPKTALPSDRTPIAPADTKPADHTPGILPDDTRAATRPEDFLPFFQFPGGSPDVSLTPRPPAPGQLPPSSATYQQK